MKLEELEVCANILGQMSANFQAMPSEKTKALEAAFFCTYAQSLVVEYAAHISKGLEPFDAMQATVNGELEIPEAKATIFKILAAKPPTE